MKRLTNVLLSLVVAVVLPALVFGAPPFVEGSVEAQFYGLPIREGQILSAAPAGYLCEQGVKQPAIS